MPTTPMPHSLHTPTQALPFPTPAPWLSQLRAMKWFVSSRSLTSPPNSPWLPPSLGCVPPSNYVMSMWM